VKIPMAASTVHDQAELPTSSAIIGAKIVKVRHTVFTIAKTSPVKRVGVSSTTRL
jgi:hypothetical protein